MERLTSALKRLYSGAMRGPRLADLFSVVNRFSGAAESAPKIRKAAENALYTGIRSSVAAGNAMKSRFQALKDKVPDASELLGKKEVSERRVFDITPTEEQEMLRDMLRRYGSDVLRPLARESEQSGWDPEDFLTETHKLGLNLFAIPEALGGAGAERSPVSTMLMAQDLASGDMGLAIAALSALSVVNTIADLGTPAQQAQYLPAFAAEDAVRAAVALAEPSVRFDPYQMQTTAWQTKDGWTLRGVKTMVPLAAQCQAMLVCANVAGEAPRAFLIETHQEGVSIEPERHMGLMNAKLGRLTLEDVSVPDSAVFGGTADQWERFVGLARIGTCSLLVGCGRGVLKYVMDYCNERTAFGEPITHRQSVAFMIADMATELDGMELMVWRAAGLAEHNQPFAREAYLAWLQCAQYAMKLGTDGVQLLGGHGYVADHPVERWYRQMRAAGVLDAGVVA